MYRINAPLSSSEFIMACLQLAQDRFGLQTSSMISEPGSGLRTNGIKENFSSPPLAQWKL